MTVPAPTPAVTMYIYKNLTLRGILTVVGSHLIWLTAWSLLIAVLYKFTAIRAFSIPWLPISVIGTAVAFYVGFKNNQAYDRFWEARKVWGGIVNSSRMWGSMVRAYITFWNPQQKASASKLQEVHRQLIYRHLAWIYTLRSQLLVPTTWEHQSLGSHVGDLNRRRINRVGVGSLPNDLTESHQRKYLPQGEYEGLPQDQNPATQLLHRQSLELALLRKEDLLDDFRHMEMQRILNDFYEHQGKLERIKKTPLPRQYGSMSFVFVCIFIFMLPFGMVSEFSKLGDWGIWLSIPFTTIIGWVFVVMELIGDYTENPFEGLGYDIPMYAICRTIEIDLLQMLGEENLPAPVQASGRGILM